MDANACDGCKLNPLRKSKEIKEAAEKSDMSTLLVQYVPMINYMTELYDYVDMGLVRELGELTPLEAALLRILHAYYRAVSAGGVMK